MKLVLARTHGPYRIVLSVLEGLALSAFICTTARVDRGARVAARSQLVWRTS